MAALPDDAILDDTRRHAIENADHSKRSGLIVQRISQAIREQNWVAVALEFLIVVSGVVIGFQITAWNQLQAERKQGETNLALIVQEIRNHQDGARASMRAAKSILKNVRTVRLGAENPEYARANPQEFMQAVYKSQFPSFSPFAHVVYEGLESSGGIALINRPEDVALIRDHYRALGRLNEIYEIGGWGAYENYNDAMARHSDLEVFLSTRDDAAILFEGTPQELAAADVTARLAYETARRIGADPVVEGPLRAIASYHFVVMTVNKGVVDRTGRLLDQIAPKAEQTAE